MIIKPGYIYVLTHPSDPNLYKIGVTVLEPKKRLAQHNIQLSKAAGSVVKETGQKWELKEYHAVSDPYWSERAFWEATYLSVIPYRNGVEVQRMDWEEVQKGLDAAKKVGLRSEQPPPPLPEWVYAYTASMKKRLEGRDISLLGYVKSMRSGKSNFRCSKGHEWRTTPWLVAEGEGCPECGIGKRTSEEIRKKINAGIICLLTHPDKPGLIRIGVGYAMPEDIYRERPWGDWAIHRYRNVEETTLAETLIWKLLGHPLPHDRGPIKKDLSIAEEAFRKLHCAIQEEMAFEEKRKEIPQKIEQSYSGQRVQNRIYNRAQK